MLLSLNLLILNLFCWNQSIATWVGSIYKVNYIQFCESVGETLVYSVQMKNTVNCCSHGNVLMCSTRCSISRRNRVLRGGATEKGGVIRILQSLRGGGGQINFISSVFFLKLTILRNVLFFHSYHTESWIRRWATWKKMTHWSAMTLSKSKQKSTLRTIWKSLDLNIRDPS